MHIIAQLRSCFGASEATLWKEKLWFTNLLRYSILLIYLSSTGEISFVWCLLLPPTITVILLSYNSLCSFHGSSSPVNGPFAWAENHLPTTTSSSKKCVVSHSVCWEPVPSL